MDYRFHCSQLTATVELFLTEENSFEFIRIFFQLTLRGRNNIRVKKSYSKLTSSVKSDSEFKRPIDAAQCVCVCVCLTVKIEWTKNNPNSVEIQTHVCAWGTLFDAFYAHTHSFVCAIQTLIHNSHCIDSVGLVMNYIKCVVSIVSIRLCFQKY